MKDKTYEVKVSFVVGGESKELAIDHVEQILDHAFPQHSEWAKAPRLWIVDRKRTKRVSA